jgi:hypothetical protein
MADKLKLYEREYYFYETISSAINIKIPKFYKTIYISNKPLGIILEDLFEKKFELNITLNKTNLNITDIIIDRMALLHSQFWNKDIKHIYSKLNNSIDPIFYPFLPEFILNKHNEFKNKWYSYFTIREQELFENIFINFENIQKTFSEGNNLTFIHGDIKSPNIFYDINNNYEPYFIDWQHCAIGKGVQDLIFFIIESFDLIDIEFIFKYCKYKYYQKLQYYGINNYDFNEYENDIYNAICYIPFFTAIWFGTLNNDELIVKTFPYTFIHKLKYLLNIL